MLTGWSALQVVCLANCAVCASGFDFSHVLNSESDTEHVEGKQAPTWKTCQTKFHSIGAAVMSCRNDKAPEGVAAHAHLADGLLHLILIRECSRPDYLRFVPSALGLTGVGRLDCRFISSNFGLVLVSEYCNKTLLSLIWSGFYSFAKVCSNFDKKFCLLNPWTKNRKPTVEAHSQL